MTTYGRSSHFSNQKNVEIIVLVKFQSKSSPTIIMFGDIAKTLIKYMGHSGTIPSAINAKDVPVALQNLQEALKNEIEQTEDLSKSNHHDENEEEYVSLHTRAMPLIELLQAAIREDEYVTWDKG